MLTLTESASTMIEHLVHDADLPEGAGLRIAQRDDHPALAMTLADHAQPRDVVVLDGGIPVFLAPIAAERLSRKTLDARTNEYGSAFYLRG